MAFYTHYVNYHFGFEPWCKLYNNSLIKDNLLFFDTEETVGEDLLFNMNYYTEIEICEFLNENLYHYVIRENSAMITRHIERYKKQMRIYSKIENILDGLVSKEVLAILFIMHIISGLNQSFQMFNLIQYRKIIKNHFKRTTFDKKLFKKLFQYS